MAFDVCLKCVIKMNLNYFFYGIILIRNKILNGTFLGKTLLSPNRHLKIKALPANISDKKKYINF